MNFAIFLKKKGRKEKKEYEVGEEENGDTLLS